MTAKKTKDESEKGPVTKYKTGHHYLLASDIWNIDTSNKDYYVVHIRDIQVKVKPEELEIVEGF